MKNLRFKLFTLCLALICAFPFAAYAQQAKPNIVVVMVDDLDVEVWKSALDPDRPGRAVLPNIQTHLIDKGTTFEQAFVSQSLCCPSRGTFHTGQYPHNSGITSNSGGYPEFIKNKEPYALAVWMKNAGYRNGYIGKYLNDSGPAVDENGDPHVPKGWHEWRAMVANPDQQLSAPQCMYGYTLADYPRADGRTGRNFYGDLDNSTDPPTPRAYHFQTDVFAQLAVDFITKPDTKPFFLVVAPTAPHIEGLCKGVYRHPDNRDLTDAPQSFIRPGPSHPSTLLVPLPAYVKYTTDPKNSSYDEHAIKDKPKWMWELLEVGDRAAREQLFNEKVAALRPVDDMVGRIVAALGEDRLRETLIMFISDNGYQYGTHRREAKQDLYEESIRVPMVVRAPGQDEPRVSQDWILNTDWAPTIVDYARAKMPPLEEPTPSPIPNRRMDGRSFKPLLGNQTTETGKRHTFLVRSGADPGSAAARRDKFLVEAPGESASPPFLMVRSKQFELTDEADGRVFVYGETYKRNDATNVQSEFYDLKLDPAQKSSGTLTPKRDAQIQRMHDRLLELKKCKGDRCRELEGI